MKHLTIAQQISKAKAELQRDIDRWNEINQSGCNDPFWPDGTNMNLVRNHIIFDLRRLAELEQKPVQLSVFMFTDPLHHSIDDVMGDKRIPPLVADDYMVKDRFENHRRIRH